MTLTAATILLYLVALFLTVVTLRLFLYATQTIRQTEPRFFLLSILVVIPLVMTIYFGFAFIISDTISLGATFPTTREEELSFSESLVVAVTYVGLSGWLWLRWRNPIAPSVRVLGPAIIATVVILIIVGVIWGADHDHMFSLQ